MTEENRDTKSMILEEKSWETGGLAERLYSKLNTPEARLAMLVGLAKHNQPARSLQEYIQISPLLFYKKKSIIYTIKTGIYHFVPASVVDPDPHCDRENGSRTDPGSIKGSQNKRGKKLVFLNFLLEL